MSDTEYVSTDVRGQVVTIGRYLLHRQIARGGMATIHIARLMGDEGFSRIVAAKRLLPEFAEDEEFVAMFLDEARIASKVHHRNVVPVLDVVTTGEEVVLVQEYVHGAPLHWLLKTARQAKTHVPLNVAVSIACQVLAGLHAAHETLDEMGMPLNIVHRDVSPQNVMVSTDGTARLLDFGVAKATMAAHVTRDGTFKGKLAYSAPEQLRGQATRQSDIYSMSVVLWELVVGHRMHQNAQAEAELIAEIMAGTLPTITEALASEREWIGNNRWKQLELLEVIVKKGLAVQAQDRWATAAEMEQALIDAIAPASATDVAAWLKALGKEFLEGRDKMIAAEEASWRKTAIPQSARRTPMANEVRRHASPRLSPNQDAEIVVTAASSQASSMSPRKKTNALIALLSGLVVLLAIGIVFAVRGPSTPVPPAEKGTDTAAAPAATPPTVAAPAAATLPAAAAAPAPRPAPIEAAAEQPQSPGETGAAAPIVLDPIPLQPATRAAPVAVMRNHNVRQPVRPTTVRASPPPPPPPLARTKAATPPPAAVTTTPPPAAPAEKPANNDCNPPYYYEGQKKIFKPACI